MPLNDKAKIADLLSENAALKGALKMAQEGRAYAQRDSTIFSTALDIAVEDISEIDRGARYTAASYWAAAKRRLYER